MANPVVENIAANTWKKVAAGVTTGKIRKKIIDVTYLYTYRDAGQPEPSDFSDSTPFIGSSLPISAASSIDVWIYASGSAGTVIVDL